MQYLSLMPYSATSLHLIPTPDLPSRVSPGLRDPFTTMRLLNVETLQLKTFLRNAPKYAILSHTWGKEEILFEDIQRGDRRWMSKQAASKLTGCCSKAKTHGYGHVWIDTCCIDKSSSAELSEAINSMYKWYQNSAVCCAYLGDLASKVSLPKLAECLWFTRGWTLQELIAPNDVRLYGRDWSFF
ncbi:het domain-containing protein [Seiridium cupressi]